MSFSAFFCKTLIMKSLTIIISLLSGAYIYAQECIDFSNYSSSYLDSITFDDTNFPNGSTFISEGNLDLIKLNGSIYQEIQGDSSMLFIGSLGIQVNNFLCSDKELIFKALYTEGLVIDNDTIYYNICLIIIII